MTCLKIKKNDSGSWVWGNRLSIDIDVILFKYLGLIKKYLRFAIRTSVIETIWLAITRIHLLVHEPEGKRFISHERLIVRLSIGDAFLHPSPIGQRMQHQTNVPVFILLLLEHLDPHVGDGHSEAIVEACPTWSKWEQWPQNYNNNYSSLLSSNQNVCKLEQAIRNLKLFFKSECEDQLRVQFIFLRALSLSLSKRVPVSTQYTGRAILPFAIDSLNDA